MKKFDVIVLGGGSAGCVLANRLSEDDSRNVLLLEAGNVYTPETYPAALTDINGFTVQPSFIWGYKAMIGAPPHDFAAFAGRLLGGTSAINGAISRRARPSDFARWQKHGLEDWSWESALAAYKALENTPTGDDAWHGRDGIWPIRQPELDRVNPMSKAFIEAAMHSGYRWIDDFNGPEQHGVGLEPRNMENNFRFNAGMIYLSDEVRVRKNLTIWGNASVDRVLFDGTTATGVLMVNGETITATEIVLCSGVFGTPAILLRSGIGPKNDLQSLGIKLVADLPVGSRLQEQPMFMVSYRLKPGVKLDPPNGSVAVWTKSKDALENDLDLQLTAFYQPDVDKANAPIHTLRVWASVVLPRSTGQLRLKSADPNVLPLIDYRLLTDVTDRERQRDIIRIARTIAATEPIASWIDHELSPGADVQSNAELDAAIDRTGGTYYHATSTAPMGTDRTCSVVNTDGVVHGVSGLRVADASAFPEMISPPVHLTVLMVAERVAMAMRKR